VKRSALVFIPGKSRHEAIAIVALMSSEMGERQMKMEATANLAFDGSANVKECAVLALNVDQLSLPYSTMGWFHRPAGEKK
jgi:hypothetical protein